MIYQISEFLNYLKINSGSSEYASSSIDLISMVSQSVDYVETYCQRKFTTGSYTSGTNERYYYGSDTLNNFTELRLDVPNIQSIETLQYYDATDGWTDIVTTISTEVLIDNNSNRIILINDEVFPYYGEMIKVGYHAGYTNTNLPYDLKTVLKEYSTMLYYYSPLNKNEGRLGIGTTNISVGSSFGKSYKDETPRWERILDKYKLRSI